MARNLKLNQHLSELACRLYNVEIELLPLLQTICKHLHSNKDLFEQFGSKYR